MVGVNVPRALVATTLAAGAVLLGLWLRPRFALHGMQAVVAASAALDYRPSLARLSADFPYRDVKPSLRQTAEADPIPHSAAVWTLIDRFDKEGGDRHALGVSFLLVGRPKDAMPRLEQALRTATTQRGELAAAIRQSNDASLLNDLAVNYLVLDDATRKPLALEAVQRAWSLERTPSIAWTRAVVIDDYHIRECSIAAWRDYLALEPRSQWSSFAHQRLNELLQPTDAELWPAAKQRLLATRSDYPALFRDVDRFRQEVRLWCEEELLQDWGNAVLSNDPSAASKLEKVRALGAALEKANGEREVSGAVAAILKSSGETLRQLAKGHVAYGAGRVADRNSKVQEAATQTAIAVAALDPRITPFAWRARIEDAGMLYSLSRYPEAMAELQEVERDCGGQLSTAGRARLDTLFAVTFNNITSYNEAANHYARAADEYRGISEHNYHAALLVRLSQALHRIGDETAARQHLRQAFEILERTGGRDERPYAMIAAAFQALEAGQQAQAGLFFDSLVEIDTASRDNSRIGTSTMWRSAYRRRVGLLNEAETDLVTADRACRSIEDPSVRERQLAFLAVAKMFGTDSVSVQSLDGLDGAIRYFEKTNNRIWLTTAYFERARGSAARGDTSAPERDFQAALRETDVNREKIDGNRRRVLFTATADEITDAYVDFLLQQHRERDAFEVSDGRRLRELVDSPTARWRGTGFKESLPDIQRDLPSGAALIEYRVLRSRIIAWVVTMDRFQTIALPRGTEDVITAVTDFQTNASYLYDALVRPLGPSIRNAKELVIVPDDELERVPFSALQDGRGHTLLEAHATVIAPSAMLFQQSRVRWLERSTKNERVLIVEAASGDQDVTALPEVAEEAKSISRLYHGAPIVDGGNVTKASLLKQFRDATILEFAGHTVVDAAAASRTLRLGPSSSGRLGAEEIAGTAMPKTRLVYLSACETDNGPVLKSEGTITLARSFFAAGVPLVVGTLWPIDDAAARVAALTFHEHLLGGDSPAESLRQAQLALLHRGAPFRDWASLRLIGAGL